MPERTTDLRLLRSGSKYEWGTGTLIAVHDIGGRYSIAEYNNERGETFFHPYMDHRTGNYYRDTEHSFYSFDEALAFCVAFNEEGANTRAHIYFIRGLGLDVTEDQ